jgi:hypothetical protein
LIGFVIGYGARIAPVAQSQLPDLLHKCQHSAIALSRQKCSKIAGFQNHSPRGVTLRLTQDMVIDNVAGWLSEHQLT